MSDKTDHEARKMYDDAIEVIIIGTFTCLTSQIYYVFDRNWWTFCIYFIYIHLEFVSISIW